MYNSFKSEPTYRLTLLHLAAYYFNEDQGLSYSFREGGGVRICTIKSVGGGPVIHSELSAYFDFI